jgi:hypothetical protein
VYTGAEFDVLNSAQMVIFGIGVSESTAAVNGPGGTVYFINNPSLANSDLFSAPNALSTNASSNGPFFVTFGVFDTSGVGTGPFDLGFSWDPGGNDPNGVNGNNFFPYANPPTQAQYTFDATSFLSAAALAAGDTAQFVLNAQEVVTAVPEPATLALLGSGCMTLAAFRARQRARRAAV